MVIKELTMIGKKIKAKENNEPFSLDEEEASSTSDSEDTSTSEPEEDLTAPSQPPPD